MEFRKKIKHISSFTLAFLLLLLAFSWAWNGQFSPYIESFPNGKIDWDKGYFYGVGTGYPHLNNGSRARALKVAQASALSAILQVASGLRVDDRQTLSDLEREKVIIQIRGLIHYEPYERKFIKETNHPFYRVTYRAPMRGVKGLTRKLFTNLRSRPESGSDFTDQELIDEDAAPWLILDARGIEDGSTVRPALFPRIVTEHGETLYDLNTVEEGALVKRGMARYVVCDKGHEELGFIPDQRPLFSLRHLFSPRIARAEEKPKRKKRQKFIIKDVTQAEGLMKTNLVISERDAMDIKKEDVSSKILKNCRVVVIVSSSLGGIEGKREEIRVSDLGISNLLSSMVTGKYNPY